MSAVSHESLKGRIALVAGGSRGVGAGVARGLAHAGCAVAVSYHRDADAADAVVEAIRSSGGRAVAVQASAADPESWNAAADVVDARFGPVDLLVSNAGSASTGRTVLDTPLTEFARLMDVHTFGPLALIQRLLPGMRAANRSDIVMISSAITSEAPERSAPYTMAKAAMETACRALAREERQYGVHVNILAPGLVNTEMGARLVKASTNGGSLEDTAATGPFGRICEPADIAAAVCFLASDHAGYITGQRLVLDGGGVSPAIF
jgi:NAD(P)-dependent dehydrogenase (short-subunit alcohol dehydrogenase family)